MKVCNICKCEKELELFKKDNRRNDGHSSSCKDCMKIKGLEYYNRTKEDRKETINKNRRNSYENNKEVENKRSKEYKKNNSESIKKYNKEYNIHNKEKLNLNAKEYYKINKNVISLYTKNYINKRLKTDNLYKTKHYLRSMINKHFKRFGYSKKSRTHEILGCSFEEFNLYLESKFESWMNWDNRGLYTIIHRKNGG